MSVFVRTLVVLAAAAAAATLPAQSLPVSVTVSGQTAVVRVGSPAAPLADVRLDFDDVTGLSPTSLGVSAEWIDVTSPALLARLSGGSTLSVPPELPLLVTVEPPAFGGLSLRRVVNVELHTHALIYTSGSRYRLLKAPLGGPFHDITGSVRPGSVRTRGSTPGFSQFIIALDSRPTTQVVAEKIARLRAIVDRLPV
ncbi:MAG TPA: DUF6689 family protein, partial [Gemmatimonadaceae bacterium]|nr:DUF6689 family protein [Gemmatimonadaceae bacterium]